MMARFQRKPREIEAVRVADLLRTASQEWQDLPWWIRHLHARGEVLFADDHIEIRTSEGVIRGERDDWVVRDEWSELCAYKPDYFEATFEHVEAEKAGDDVAEPPVEERDVDA